jgi:filamentous hemagglutinin family protein
MTTTIQPGAIRSKMRRKAGALLLAACYLAGPAVQAAPTLPQLVNGQATFNQQGNVFSITNTPGTIINWQSFNIGAGEITRFIQQGSDSAVLNRIVGQDPTKILGALQSNGKVFLINPNGILFGQGSRIDVNGLVASTLNLSDADFLAGKKNFQAGSVAGAAVGTVRNEGAITTPTGGKVFLIAPNVENTGIITAPNGEVVLAAGRSVHLADTSDPNVQVVVSAPLDQALNLGKVIAQGGRIGIYGALVSQRGVVNADSAMIGANGKIVLKASGAATPAPPAAAPAHARQARAARSRCWAARSPSKAMPASTPAASLAAAPCWWAATTRVVMTCSARNRPGSMPAPASAPTRPSLATAARSCCGRTALRAPTAACRPVAPAAATAAWSKPRAMCST